ncbi:glycosyltransferase [Erwinia sp. D4-22]
MNTLVSIITPTYNAEKFINVVYESLTSQTHLAWEWLVTDDCSIDNTYKILENLANNDRRIKLRKNSVNSGAAITRNASLARATGEFIAFIDSDDVWAPEKLEKQIAFMGDTIDFSFTAYKLISENGEDLGKSVDTFHTRPLNYHDMLKKKATLGCSTVMLRRDAIKDYKMPLLRTGQDYALWLKILKSGINAYPLTEVLTNYRIVANSISRNKLKKAKRQWQIYRNVEGLGVFYSLYCFLFYAWRAVFRK